MVYDVGTLIDVYTGEMMNSQITQSESNDGNVVPYSVSHSRSPEQKVSKALVKALNDRDLDFKALGFFMSYDAPGWAQEAFLDLFMSTTKAITEIYEAKIETNTLTGKEKNYNAMIKAMRIRDALVENGMWND